MIRSEAFYKLKIIRHYESQYINQLMYYATYLQNHNVLQWYRSILINYRTYVVEVAQAKYIIIGQMYTSMGPNIKM